MKVKQISVFLENKWGRLSDITSLLGNNNINIRALCIADTSDFGILRMIVDNPKKAYDVLSDNKYTVAQTDVLAVEISDKPGGLAEVLRLLKDKNLNIEYIYCFVSKSQEVAINVMRIEQIDIAIETFKNQGIKLISGEDLYNI